MDFSLSRSIRSQRRLERNQNAMREAINFLNSEGVRFIQTNQYTLQFFGYSYWPGTRKLFHEDAEHSLPDQGLDEIAALIRSSKKT